MNTNTLSIHDIAAGASASFEKTWTEEDVRAFAALSGDRNPLHMDEAYARTTRFGRRIVHGMLVASSFSALVGMHLPGKRALYLRQTLSFRHPVHIGNKLSVRGEVTHVSASTGIIDIAVSIHTGKLCVIEGVATVQVLPEHPSTSKEPKPHTV